MTNKYLIRLFLKEMSKFKLDPNKPCDHHVGHLLQHSKWTAEHFIKSFRCKTKLTRFTKFLVNKKDRRIAVLAGFLHDLGKMGDRKYVYSSKPDHPRTGYNYMLGRTPFYFGKTPIKICKFLKDAFYLTNKDLALIAITNEMHYDMGNIALKKQTFQGFIKKLKVAASECERRFHLINPLNLSFLVKLCIAVSAADICGAHPQCADCVDMTEIRRPCRGRMSDPNKVNRVTPFDLYKTGKEGWAIRKKLLRLVG
jgi:hypothetical protein